MPLHVPQTLGPYGCRHPFPPISPVKESSLKVPFMESHAERCPITRALLHSSIKVPGIRAPLLIPGSPRLERCPYGERCSYPASFLTYLPGSPVKKHPRGPLHGASSERERRSILRAAFIRLSKSPFDEPLSGSPVGPLWKEMPASRSFSTYPSGSPGRETSL